MKKLRKMMKGFGRLSSSAAGFTLMEMMIVIAVIALVMALVGSNVAGRFNRAKVDTTKIQIKALETALEDFKRDCGFYPMQEQGLEALTQKPSGGRECKNYDPQGYVKGGKLPNDAWGTPFNYLNDGNKFTIISLGDDSKEGGEGLSKDIRSDE